MMTLREAILDTFADDGESIVQIREYLKYLDISNTRKDIIKMLDILWKEKKIMIVYPQNINVNSLSDENIDDLWFELTDIGRNEWKKIKE